MKAAENPPIPAKSSKHFTIKFFLLRGRFYDLATQYVRAYRFPNVILADLMEELTVFVATSDFAVSKKEWVLGVSQEQPRYSSRAHSIAKQKASGIVKIKMDPPINTAEPRLFGCRWRAPHAAAAA